MKVIFTDNPKLYDKKKYFPLFAMMPGQELTEATVQVCRATYSSLLHDRLMNWIHETVFTRLTQKAKFKLEIVP